MKNNKTAYKCGYMQALTDLQAQIDTITEWARPVSWVAYSEIVQKKDIEHKIELLREVMDK